MKKILFALVAVALLTFNSCGGSSDSDDAVDRQCYELTYTYKDIPVSSYLWASAAEVIIGAEALKLELANEGIDVNVTYKLADKSDKSSCEKANNPLDPSQSKCWAMTVSYGLISNTTYIWGTEAVIQAAVAKAKEEMAGNPEASLANITYAEAAADDASSCAALNKNGYTN